MSDQPLTSNRFSDEYAREDIVSIKPPLWRRSWDLRRPSFVLGSAMLILSTLVLLALAVFILPERIVQAPTVAELDQLQPVEIVQAKTATATAQNAVRTTLVQAIGGGLFFVTAFVAWQQVRTARQGQATDRFTKSIEQIGDEKTDVRLGGIYALNQMSDIQSFRRPVAEILAAYLRTHSSKAEEHSGGKSPAGKPLRVTTALPSLRRQVRGPQSSSSTLEAQRSHEPDKQAVLRILVHENLWRRAEAGLLDLSFVDLRGADLREADLGHALMRGIDISYGDLRSVRMRQVDIRYANLTRANMANCDMRNALLENAHFTGADLSRAMMAEVQASNADFRGARLTRVDLTGADLTGADLRGATLNGAVLTEVSLLGARLEGANFFDVVDVSGAQFDGRFQFDSLKIDEESRERLLALVDDPGRG